MIRSNGRTMAVVAAVLAVVLVLCLLPLLGGLRRHSRPPVRASPPVAPPSPARSAEEGEVRTTGSLQGDASDQGAHPPTAMPSTVEVIVRDCWDGSAVPGLPLGVGEVASRPDEGDPLSSTIISDGAGRVTVAVKDACRLKCLDADWTLSPPPGAGVVLERRELWAYRSVRVRAHVRPDRPEVPLDLKTVVVFARPTPAKPAIGAQEVPFHGSVAWLGTSGLDAIDMRLPWNRGSDCFEADLPRIPDIGLRAGAAGYRPAIAMIPRGRLESGEPVDVELLLRPAVLIRGWVVTEAGAAVANLRVQLFTSFRTDPDGYQALWLRGGPFTAEVRPTGQIGACLRRRALTDKDGRFEIQMDGPEGSSRIIIWEKGHSPTFVDLGSVDRSPGDLKIELCPPDSHGETTLLLEGRPLANHDLFLSDLTQPDMQPAVMLGLGPGGTVPAEWFAVGRKYGIGVAGPLCASFKDRYLEWNGQGTVELSDLPLATEVLSR